MKKKCLIIGFLLVTISLFGCNNVENEDISSEASLEISFENNSNVELTTDNSNETNNNLSLIYANRYSKDNGLFISQEDGLYKNMALATVDAEIAVANEGEMPETVSKIWNERITTASDNINGNKLVEDNQEKLDKVLTDFEKYDKEIILMNNELYGINGIVPGSMYKDMLTDYIMTDYELIGGAFLSWEYELIGSNSMNINALSEETDLSAVNWRDFGDESVVMEYDSDFEGMIGEYDLVSADDKTYYSLSKELCSQLAEIANTKIKIESYVDDYYTLIGSMADFERSISGDEMADRIKTVRMKNMFLKLLNAKYLMSI
ncbi:hypothetical protein [Butyrivibrio sp. XB500-5]|uniref:hypothetical protein n=1 Tax=Butyrivibrio sp. XB500-5 TaxID=2364880 RepID=UPI0011C22F59|nr:hypothetical protein [Butyrivibrio sp. XB500-5]